MNDHGGTYNDPYWLESVEIEELSQAGQAVDPERDTQEFTIIESSPSVEASVSSSEECHGGMCQMSTS